MDHKNIIYSISLAIILLVLSSCYTTEQEQHKGEYETEKVSFNPRDASFVFMEEFMESFYFIPLSDADGFQMGEIKRIFLTEDEIIIKDSRQDAVFIFNKDGSPKAKIHAAGKGPGEYTNITDIAFDEEKRQVEVFDAQVQKIFIYNTSGEFQSEKSFKSKEQPGLSLYKSGDHYLFDRSNLAIDGKRVAMFDDELRFLGAYLTIPELVRSVGIGHHHRMEKYGGKLYYLPLLDHKIYTLSDSGATAAYLLDVPEKSLPQDEWINGARAADFLDYNSKVSQSNAIYDTDNLFMTDDYIYFNYQSAASRGVKLFYSRKSKEVRQVTDYPGAAPTE